MRVVRAKGFLKQMQLVLQQKSRRRILDRIDWQELALG
jgi:hypothetical protein